MTKHRLGFLAATTLTFALAIGVAPVVAGCGGPTKMTAAKNAPFTEGTVEASSKSNGNGSVTIHVKNLGDPAKLDKAATTYVVWVTPDGGAAQNAGALKVNGDMEGELEFTTPFKKFQVVITPEASADVSAKGGSPVLTADVTAD